MAEEETPRQKIARLEIELDQAKRMVSASTLALAFTHEVKGRMRLMSAGVRLAKDNAGYPEKVLNYLAKIDGDLDLFSDRADKAMRAYWDGSKKQEPA